MSEIHTRKPSRFTRKSKKNPKLEKLEEELRQECDDVDK